MLFLEFNFIFIEYEKVLLCWWVEQGVEWKKYWVFLFLEMFEVFEVGVGWVQNEIDYFVYVKLQEQGLQFFLKVEKVKFICCFFFDLWGLLFILEEIDVFVGDDCLDVWECLVDIFFNFIVYVECMALDWMDIVWYVDIYGYQDDFEWVMWLWCDWVIYVFKENMFYDQFVIWQLAGDLLLEFIFEQCIVIGFNCNYKIMAEGGVIDEEYWVEYVVDCVQILGIVFFGLIMECVKCYDYKYDFIS